MRAIGLIVGGQSAIFLDFNLLLTTITTPISFMWFFGKKKFTSKFFGLWLYAKDKKFIERAFVYPQIFGTKTLVPFCPTQGCNEPFWARRMNCWAGGFHLNLGAFRAETGHCSLNCGNFSPRRVTKVHKGYYL